MKEKRKHTRIPLKFNLEVKTADGRTFEGYTKDISFGGTRITLTDKNDLKIDQECTVSLILQTEPGPKIDFNCRVIHIHKSDLGLKFLSIEGLDSYDHFKNLMVFNHKQPDHLLKELEEHPGLIVE